MPRAKRRMSLPVSSERIMFESLSVVEKTAAIVVDSAHLFRTVR
jgi:hypothetical protein